MRLYAGDGISFWSRQNGSLGLKGRCATFRNCHVVFWYRDSSDRSRLSADLLKLTKVHVLRYLTKERDYAGNLPLHTNGLGFEL
jgi:hypothetical protein